jgi:hypothetical protein
MNIYQRLALVTSSLILSLGAREVQPVQAANFSFSFPPPPNFLNLTGTFEASDLDFNSLITQNEVTNFEVISPGFSVFSPPLRYNLDNLVILTLDLTNFNNFEFLATDSTFTREFATANNIFERNNDLSFDLVDLIFANDPNASVIATSNEYNPLFIRDIGTSILQGEEDIGASINVPFLVESTDVVKSCQ